MNYIEILKTIGKSLLALLLSSLILSFLYYIFLIQKLWGILGFIILFMYISTMKRLDINWDGNFQSLWMSFGLLSAGLYIMIYTF